MFKVTVNKTQPKLDEKEPMTSGSQNVYVAEFEFSDEWSVLHRTAVFRAGDVTINVVLDDTNRCFIPWECLIEPGYPLYVGAFGTMGYDTVLPTIWVKIDDILEGVTTGVYPSEPTPDVYQQLLAKLEDIKGPKGDTGPRGPQGPKGDIGPQGIQGIQGETGNGISSIDRTSGDGSPGTVDTYTITMTDGSTSTFFVYNGSDGNSFIVSGRYDTLDSLKAEHPTGVVGEAWAVGTPDDNVIYLWDTRSGEWTSIGPLRGPKGDAGPTGMSAYQYAVAGGYTGSEDQFKSLLADVPNKQDKISGSEGQLVGFTPGGDAASFTPNAYTCSSAPMQYDYSIAQEFRGSLDLLHVSLTDNNYSFNKAIRYVGTAGSLTNVPPMAGWGENDTVIFLRDVFFIHTNRIYVRITELYPRVGRMYCCLFNSSTVWTPWTCVETAESRRELLYSLIIDAPSTNVAHTYSNMHIPFIDTTTASERIATASLSEFMLYINNRYNRVSSADTSYTTSMGRGISLVTSAPTSISNGCIVGVY